MIPAYAQNKKPTYQTLLQIFSKYTGRIRLAASPGAVIGLLLMSGVVLVVSIGSTPNQPPIMNEPTKLAATATKTSAENNDSEKITAEKTAKTTALVVYVSGAVQNPGVYELPNPSRANDAVKAAGGFTEAANSNTINLAEPVNDGQQIHIPTQTETTVTPVNPTTEIKTNQPTSQNFTLENNCVNLQTATASQLATLNGIGEKTAQRIIEYRHQHPVKTPEDLLEISGIGVKTIEKITAGLCR